ncbi:MAG: Gfo/Idh/MocA family oxidoreductase [bacterium]|nr:Gfo/Idh/MocA family oxidoreductase [bacterium]
MASNSSPIRFAVIGAGMIGGLHAKLISEMEETELVAVCSRDLERARGLTDSFGGEPTTDLEGVLGRADVDAVSICTASGEHATFGIPAARAGKHVLVEKPIEISLEQADAMIQACEECGVKLGVIFQLRFLNASRKVKRALDEGVLGRLVMADCYMKFYRPQDYYDGSRWKGTLALDGGGALINQGIHGLDLLLHLAGDVASVQAYTGILAHENIEVEDTCVATVKYQNGALGVIQATTSVHPDFQQRIELHGTEGTIILEGTEDTWVAHWETFGGGKREGQVGLVDHAGAEAVLHEGGEAHRRQIEDFVAAVREDREPAVNGEEGRRSLAVVQAVYESVRVGGEVCI